MRVAVFGRGVAFLLARSSDALVRIVLFAGSHVA